MPFRCYQGKNWADLNEDDDKAFSLEEWVKSIEYYKMERIRYRLELKILRLVPKVVYALIKWKRRALRKFNIISRFKQTWYTLKIRTRLVVFVRLYRSRQYIRHMAYNCVHYWMETNCAKHLHNNLLNMIQNHIRFQTVQKAKLPQGVLHVLTRMKELTSRVTPIIKGIHDVNPDAFTGHMLKHLSQLQKDVDEYATLKLNKKIVKLYKGETGIGGVVDMLHNSLQRKLLIWRVVVEKTFRICKVVPLPHRKTPDYLFLCTVAAVVPPEDKDHNIYQIWSKLSGFCVEMGLDVEVVISLKQNRNKID